jgi:lysophospholipase L1-like esterase
MDEILELNELIRGHCRRNKIRLIDAHPHFDDGSGRLKKEYSHGDGGHLNGAGYKRLGELIAIHTAELLQPGNIVACLGDSITEGYPGHLNERKKGNEWQPYTHYLQKPKMKVLNFGVSGDTTDGMTVRFFRDVLKSRATACIILGGVNDILGGIPASEAFQNLSALYAECDRQAILPIAVTVLPID